MGVTSNDIESGSNTVESEDNGLTTPLKSVDYYEEEDQSEDKSTTHKPVGVLAAIHALCLDSKLNSELNSHKIHCNLNLTPRGVCSPPPRCTSCHLSSSS